MKSLEDPSKHQIDYVMVPNPRAGGKFSLDGVNQKYPHLYEQGAEWASLYQEFNGYWKLYKVHGGTV